MKHETMTDFRDEAVSPVVGVMLMLVVTIIVAAVVSAFSGGLVTTEQKAPSMIAETKITNTGLFTGSNFIMTVKSVSEPIQTSDLKLVTSWTARDGTSGGATCLPGVPNTVYSSYNYAAPKGYGQGVEEWSLYNQILPEMHFGNYTIQGGTYLYAYPYGPFYGPYTGSGGYGPTTPSYTYVNGNVWDSSCTDSMMGVLGDEWFHLRSGDVVNVKIVHVPSGKTIHDEDVVVTQ
jgi:FlaG/FlaF family flagellin (archaellin)